MKLSIIIVSWNVKAILSNCIESIIHSPPSFPYEIIVIDNASTDETVEFIESHYPFVKTAKNTENKGFASANNQGATISRGEYLFFLNPDTIILPDALDKLVCYLDYHSDVAMCGPLILNKDETLQTSVRNLPSFRGALYRYTILKYLGLFKSHFETWHNRNFDYTNEADVKQIIGAALLIRRSAFEKIGGFDERFFMYYEEVDLCRRLATDNARIVYFPQAKIIHLKGGSAKQIPARIRFMMLRSLLLYFQKHSASFAFIPFSIVFKCGVLSRQLYELVVFFCGYWFCRLTHNSTRANKNKIRYKTALNFIVNFYFKFLFC